ncbi:MAG: SurA N-terminal domain-containing protein [Pseudomonadota bacterium]
MLLGLMRRHAKSWLIKALIAIIAVVFIFYFGYSFRSEEGLKVAYVNGELISVLEYQKAYRESVEALQKQYKGLWNDNLIKVYDLKNQVLGKLVSLKLISQEARRIGLEVTKKEIQDEIMAYPAFQFKGRFDENRYRSLLQNNRMNPEDFEAGLAEELLQKKLTQFLMTLLPVTDQEVSDHYTFFNKKVKIGFVQFLPENFKASVKLDQAAMEKYFKEHIEEYRVPEKIKIAYIKIDPEDFKDKVKITDQGIKEYYEENRDRFHQEKQIRARHILFKLAENASEDDEKRVRDKALSVEKKAREGEDFAKLAKEYSEGPTKEEGGDLGFFSRGQMVKTFEEAAFKLKKGEISEPVRTIFGYHIIKVDEIKEARTKPLDEVQGEISELLTNMATVDLAHEKALSLTDQMPYDVDLKQYGEKHQVPVIYSDFFSQDESIPGIEGDEKLRQSIFSLKKNDVSELLEFDNKFYIVQVIEKRPSYLPEMKEVHKGVKENYTAYLSMQEAKLAAENYLSQLKGGKSWEKLSKETRLTPKTTKFFTRKDPLTEMGYDRDIREASFSLSENSPYPDKVFENEQGVFVIRWEGQEGIDEEKYQKEKEKLRYAILMGKQQSIFGDWLESLKKKAEIEIIAPVD